MLNFLRNLLASAPKVKTLEGLEGLARTDAIFHNLVAERKVPGISVTLLQKGEILLQKGYGYANLERRIRIDPNSTIFRIASISKCITGLALGKMVEEGLMDLDASFYEYVPHYPRKKFDFTIRQLAGHTAGIRAYRGKEFALNKPFSIEESTQVFENEPLVFKPGKGYLYNSFDFVLLSLAMQEVAGVPFKDYVGEKVLSPLGMQNTITPIDHTQRNTMFYTKTGLGFRESVPVNNYYKLAGGGYLSTSQDIAKLGQAILEQRLLRKETYEEIFSTQQVKGKSTYYGLGFQVSEDAKGRQYVGHVGNSVGAYTNFHVYPEEQLVISVLINCTDPKIQNNLDQAIHILFGEKDTSA
nr:serine hydrolase domain-containing protein [Allomuricauda sp.]